MWVQLITNKYHHVHADFTNLVLYSENLLFCLLVLPRNMRVHFENMQDASVSSLMLGIVR